MRRPFWREDRSAFCSAHHSVSGPRRARHHTLLPYIQKSPNLEGHVRPRIYIPQKQGCPVIPPGTWVLFPSPLNDTQGYDGVILIYIHTGKLGHPSTAAGWSVLGRTVTRTPVHDPLRCGSLIRCRRNVRLHPTSYPLLWGTLPQKRPCWFLRLDRTIITALSRTRQNIQTITKANSVAFSPQANCTDWATATCWRN
jgi:hypothetical protein